MLKENTRYVLRNPEGIEKTITIKDEQDLQFWSKYEGRRGFTFKEQPQDEMKFKPRVHVSDTVCFACE